MPVIGHAFAGLGVGQVAGRRVRLSRCRGYWLGAMVGLAYLPDIVGQAGAVIGLYEARAASHSILCVVVGGVLCGLGVAWGFGVSRWVGVWIGVGSLAGHVGLDYLQSSDRRLLWPFDWGAGGADWRVVPVNTVWEAGVFGGAFVVVVVVDRWIGGKARGRAHGLSVGGVALVGLVMVAASVTHWLRGERMLALERVNAALASGRYEEVLARADEVERWPGVGKRGRADYMRGEAYLGLGDRSAAEAYLVKAVAGDPDYFWPLADLAALRAGGAGTVAERRAVVAPLVTSLRGRFGSHPDLGRVLAKIDRLVGAER